MGNLTCYALLAAVALVAALVVSDLATDVVDAGFGAGIEQLGR
jgi:hypothetical protein